MLLNNPIPISKAQATLLMLYKAVWEGIGVAYVLNKKNSTIVNKMKSKKKRFLLFVCCPVPNGPRHGTK